MRHTRKQRAILLLVLRGNPDGTFLDIDQLMEQLPYKSTKQAIQCSIRVLEEHDYVHRGYESRRGQRRVVINPTVKAYREYRVEFGAESLGAAANFFSTK